MVKLCAMVVTLIEDLMHKQEALASMLSQVLISTNKEFLLS